MGALAAARRSDVAYYLGDFSQAAEWAEKVGEPFYSNLTKTLTTSPMEGKRVQLDVGFVRQHYKTCAPATLAAIGRFWNMPAQHLELAEAICYDGTPHHRQRHWAEENDWVAREFTVTWDSAQALIDRGLPFTITVGGPTFSHLQAVIGYDSRRGTLLIRDPSERHFQEFDHRTFLERYRSIGPQCMVLATRDKADLLKNLELSDAVEYDQYHLIECALDKHDRALAESLYQDMKREGPGHRLALHARWLLAHYDSNPTEALASVNELLELFPNDPLLLKAKVAWLGNLSRREDRLLLLEQISADRKSDPVFWQMYAQELSADAREHETAVYLARRAIRYRPWESGSLATLANIRLHQRRFAEALELFRFGLCLNITDEGLAWSYFSTARLLKQADAALDFLQKRFERHGKQSSQPARTLFWAFDQLERMPEAFALLDKALSLRPEDGELMTFTAEKWAVYGESAKAEELQADAQGRCSRTHWLKSAATMAWSRGDLTQSLALWRQVLEIEPLNLEAHRAVSRLLAETESAQACLDHLRQACERSPHNYPLHQLWIEWLRSESPAAIETAVRRILAIHPADAWAYRELALSLSHQGRRDEALAALETAFSLEPSNSSYFSVHGQVCARAGQAAQAKEAYRQAIKLSADNYFAIDRLMELSDSLAERQDALGFIKEELTRQVIFGDGLLAYKRHAQIALVAEELTTLLRQALTERPDLWHAWSALAGQLAETGRLEEARDLAQKAAERFPLLPQIWLDLASVAHARGDKNEEFTALERALQINPAWGHAAWQLASAHEREGELAEAKRVLEQTVRRSPLDSGVQAKLADVLWHQGEKQAALERIQQAVRCNSRYDWAWDKLREWSNEKGQPEVAINFARNLADQRSGDAHAWLMLAKMLPADKLDERLAVLDRSISLHPRLLEAYDLKAALLMEVKRFDEAFAACRPSGFDPVPIQLRGRAAWVEWQRGNTGAAVEQMRELVTQDPNYYWAWYQLAEWSRELNQHQDYLQAANHLVRLAPEYANSYGFRGEAKLRASDRIGAKEDFRRALDLDANYQFGWYTLFELELEDRDYEAVAKTVRIIRKSGNEPEALAREVRLAAKRRDRKKGLEVLRTMCELAEGPPWPLESAISTMVEAGWGSAAERVLKMALDAKSVHPRVGALWVQRCTARGSWRCRKRLPELVARGEIGLQALVAYAEALAKKNRWIRLRRLVNRYQAILREKTWSWGHIGYAFTQTVDYQKLVWWMEDWAQRIDAEPWMLTNLALSLRALGQMDKANRVSHHALTLKEDHSGFVHSLWLAFDEALDRKTDCARKRLDGIANEKLEDFYKFLRILVEAMVSVQEANVENRSRAFRRARKTLMQSWRHWQGADFRALLPSYRRALWRISGDCGGVIATIWAYWRQINPLVPRPVLGR